MAGNAKLLATVLSDEPSLSFQRVFPHIDSRTLDPANLVQALLADWHQVDESVVLSAENFRPNHAARLKHLLPAVEIVVVLFVRTQDQWIESYHNQLLKTGDIHQDLPDFIMATLSRSSDRLCYPDWWEHYAAWRDTFGACSVQIYDEAREDLFGSFFRAAGLPTPQGIAEIPRQQESINLYQIAYLQALDGQTPFADFARRRAASLEAARQLGGPDARLLRRADRNRLAKLFSESNARLLEALGRSGDDPALRFSWPASEPLFLEEISASVPYRNHKALADEIYAGLT
jgi:hypothetical protein